MIALVHLVWAPLGAAPLREFLDSHRAHPAGAEYELVILLNGAGAGGPAGEATRRELLAEIEGVEHQLLELDRPMQDIAAYVQAARRLEHERVCFVNSYATILVDGWLGLVAGALDRPDVGLVGASGSWESQAEWRRGPIRHWPVQLAGLAAARHDYPRFPNPHVRTSTFMVERALMAELSPSSIADKRAAYLLESGHDSITRRVQRRGLRAVVVGRDGVAYDVERWPQSRTFRSGDQENLLVADNQTRDYQVASRWRRCQLARASWGRPSARNLCSAR